jgi:hypothetical protein
LYEPTIAFSIPTLSVKATSEAIESVGYKSSNLLHEEKITDDAINMNMNFFIYLTF